MHAPYVLRIRTVSNSDGLYGEYDPSTALSIRTVTIRTDRTDRTTPCSDVIMRCTLRMCSEYGPLATLMVCTERTIRQLLSTVRNSVTVLDMTGIPGLKMSAFGVAFGQLIINPLNDVEGGSISCVRMG